MDATATVSFRMDAKLKKKFESIIQMMGLNMTTAFTVFAIPVVNEGRSVLVCRESGAIA